MSWLQAYGSEDVAYGGLDKNYHCRSKGSGTVIPWWNKCGFAEGNTLLGSGFEISEVLTS